VGLWRIARWIRRSAIGEVFRDWKLAGERSASGTQGRGERWRVVGGKQNDSGRGDLPRTGCEGPEDPLKVAERENGGEDTGKGRFVGQEQKRILTGSGFGKKISKGRSPKVN